MQPGGRPGSPRRSRQPAAPAWPSSAVVLAVASLGAAVAFVDATIVNIAFPNIAHSFTGTSISSLSWVLNAYNIVFAAFLVAAGRIADLLGRRRCSSSAWRSSRSPRCCARSRRRPTR